MMGTPLEITQGALKIKKVLEDGLKKETGLLIGRFGTVEFEGVYWNEVWPGCWPEDRRDVLERNAGIFPSDKESVRRWVTAYSDAIRASSVLAVGWHPPIVKEESSLLSQWGWKGIKVPLRSLEPYYVKERWTKLLAEQHVCVVTSFAETASAQVKKGEYGVWEDHAGELWGNSGTSWSFVQTGYAPSLAHGRAGWEDSPESWEEAVENTVSAVIKSGARIILIGCGGLGMIIGDRLRAAGKICIVMGGAIQVLFGIKGHRWEQHPVISGFWREEWVWPALEETPRGAEGVEDGCYWGGKDKRT